MHSRILDTEFAAIDFESAGSAPGKTDAPIQIGIATWSLKNGILDLWTSYIFTDEDITWSAQKVHGISKNELSDAPKLALLWPKIKQHLQGRAVVAHGHGTEKRFLRAFPGHAFGPWIDTLTLARKAWPQLPSHSLGEITNSLDLAAKTKTLLPEKNWHDALFDALASIFILEHLIQSHSLEEQTLSCLC